VTEVQAEASQVAALLKRIGELEAALQAAQVDRKRLADADTLVSALRDLVVAA
jgi:hypothetical protein